MNERNYLKNTRPSYYVHRIHDDGRNGWVGPIRSSRQADREVAAWQGCGGMAWKHESGPWVKAHVRAWQKQAHQKKGE